jgi:hypothetical protein
MEEKNNGSPKDFETLMGIEYIDIKGQEAVDKLLEEKQGHVKGAFYRDDIGEIDLFWGDETAGLCHIVKRRKEEDDNPVKFLKNINIVIENGEIFQNKRNPERMNIAYKGKMAIITFELLGIETTALLTAFYT